MPYTQALALQRAVARARISGAFREDLLLLVEHPPVITTGRSTKRGNLLASLEMLAARGVELHDVERGGDVTFHGPGQLVGYPIVDLKRHTLDLHWYLRRVEDAIIVALGAVGVGVGAGRSPGQTGVWVDGRKIASIGVHARDWVTWHGFALNVTTDLSFFDLMVPCGIGGVQMTSVREELRLAGGTDALSPASAAASVGSVTDLWRETVAAVVSAFSDTFGLEPLPLDPGDLRRVAGTDP